ncbi:MAG: hypothetical protein IJY96_01580 [Oscillospiraceae bacterium]|nr:hypothetical protein [Oscillospiraceae bacterium]
MYESYIANWARRSGIRALKTFAQSFASLMTVGVAVNEISWGYIASVSTVAAVYSLVTSLAGLPELEGAE